MMQSVWGWRGAFIGAGMLGFAVAAYLVATPTETPAAAAARQAPAKPPAGGC